VPRSKRFPGMHGNLRAMRDKYANCERSTLHGQSIRMLTPLEIQQWYERLDQILGRPDRARAVAEYRKAEIINLRERLTELESA
jgi:ABC-type Fe3+-hydroxamate transport system substrate-binding protein